MSPDLGYDPEFDARIERERSMRMSSDPTPPSYWQGRCPHGVFEGTGCEECTPTPPSAMALEEAEQIIQPIVTLTIEARQALRERIARALSERDERNDRFAEYHEKVCPERQATLDIAIWERVAAHGHLDEAQAQLRERDAKLAAKDAALQFAGGAIVDAIYTEAGLDPAAGEAVLHICREARESGTFDKEPFDRNRLPSILVETLRAQLRARPTEPTGEKG